MIYTRWRCLIFSWYMIYSVCWILSDCPSNLKTDLHTTDAFLWFPQHCLSKSTRDGAMTVPSSEHRVQDVTAKTLKFRHTNEFHCDYLASPLASLFKNSPNHASQLIFLTRVNECFWTTLEKQNYKRHI